MTLSLPYRRPRLHPCSHRVPSLGLATLRCRPADEAASHVHKITVILTLNQQSLSDMIDAAIVFLLFACICSFHDFFLKIFVFSKLLPPIFISIYSRKRL
jgi:hypothetical protein